MQRQKAIHFDMTEGNIIKQLLIFSWPLLVGNIFQQLYNTVNAIILGNYIGSEALASVGVFNPINNLLLGLFTGISTGATVMVSQSFGAKNKQRLNQSVLVSIYLSIIGGILIGIIGVIVSKPLLQLIGTPDVIFPMALSYAQMMFVGMISMFFYNILAGVLRGMGDSVVPLLFLIFSNLVNGAALYFFVVVRDGGIRSAAYSTIIAEATAGILTFIYLMRTQDKYGISIKGLKPDWSYAKELFRIGLPAGLQTSIFSVGFMLQQNLINQFGEVLIAAYTVVTRVDPFVTLPLNSFSIALTTFVGQNIGANKLERTEEGIKKTVILSQIIAFLLSLVLFIFGDKILALFSKDLAVVTTGTMILRTLSIGYVLVNNYFVLSGAVRGAGDSVAPLMASMICNVVIRVSLAYLLVYLTGDFRMIFVTIVIAWTLATIFMSVYYRKGMWKKKIRGLI
jgi:putative MATE family efflux protein